MATVDLKSAYRSVHISAHSQKVTGFKWFFTEGVRYFIDNKLPFGSKAAPGIFHRLSQAVRRIMLRKGFTIVAYLDDFFLCETTRSRCALAVDTLISLLRELGFMINWSKVVGTTQMLTFLGVEFDTVAMCLQLPQHKLHALRGKIGSLL